MELAKCENCANKHDICKGFANSPCCRCPKSSCYKAKMANKFSKIRNDNFVSKEHNNESKNNSKE